MHFDGLFSPIQDQRPPSASDTDLQQQQEQKKESLTTKVRQTLNAVRERVQSSRPRKTSVADLTNLTSQSQELILHAVKTIRNEDSQQIIAVLDESRSMMRNSFDEFKREQNEFREQLEYITKCKEAEVGRRKENAIPLSIFMRQKRDTEGLADLRPNSGMNTTYQAYFEALLLPHTNQQQHSSDRAAVVKYIRRRERRKRAEESRENHQLSDEILEKQKSDILQKMDGIDMKLEQERERQSNLLHTKIEEKKIRSQKILEAGEIIGQAHDANLARERVEQKHREKIEARVTEARNRTPTNIIHVQSRDPGNEKLNDEQRSATQTSIQLLNENDGYTPRCATTPVYGDNDTHEKIATIQI